MSSEMQRGKGEAMAGETEDRVRRLRELRDGGAISDEDYRKMVLDLLDGDEGNAQGKAEGAAETDDAPSPEPVASAPEQTAPKPVASAPEQPAAKPEPAVPSSGQPATKPEEPAGRPPKPAASVPTADAPKAKPRPKKKALVAAVAAAVVVLAVVAYGFLSGDIAFKPADVSQEYWDAGREARAIGKDYLSGKISAEDAHRELCKCRPSDNPNFEVADPSKMSNKEEENDMGIAEAVRHLTFAINQEYAPVATTGDKRVITVREALHELDKALQGES